MPSSLTIGRLAAAADVHVETVRYYQRRGLLQEPPRPLGGIRRYGDSDLNRLQSIRRAQAMGFSLEEIAGLLAITGADACRHTRQATETRLAEVRRRLEDLRRLEAELVALVDKCRQSGTDDSCPTLDRLQR